MNARHWMIFAGIAALLVALVLLAPRSFAQTPTPARGTGMGPFGNGWQMDQMHGREHGGRMGMHDSLVAVAAEQLDMTQADLVAQLQAGASIGQIAQTKGVATERIVEAFIAQHTTWLNQLVASGRLTQAEADARLATIQEHVTAQFNQPGMPQGGRGAGFRDADGDGICDYAATSHPGMGMGYGHGPGGAGR